MAPKKLKKEQVSKVLTRSAKYRRKVKQNSKEIMDMKKSVTPIQQQSINREESNVNSGSDISLPRSSNSSEPYPQCHIEEIEDTSANNWLIGSDNEEEIISQQTLLEMENNFRSKLSEWAFTTQQTPHQLKELLKVCNDTLPFKLPQDPLEIFAPKRWIIIVDSFEDGSQYWHHGLIDTLKLTLKNVKSLPDHLSLNINVNRLTKNKNSLEEFWPILCNIHELKFIEPIVIGIYRGIGMCLLIYEQFRHAFVRLL